MRGCPRVPGSAAADGVFVQQHATCQDIGNCLQQLQAVPQDTTVPCWVFSLGLCWRGQAGRVLPDPRCQLAVCRFAPVLGHPCVHTMALLTHPCRQPRSTLLIMNQHTRDEGLSFLSLQALFEPLEMISELKRLVGHLLQPGVAGWYLYTAPPKTVSICRMLEAAYEQAPCLV